MPRGSKDITRYARYFNLKIPLAHIGLILLIILGFGTGVLSSLIIHHTDMSNIIRYMLQGGGAGILAVSVPALLTTIFIKYMRSNMKLRNILFATLAISAVYAAFIVFDAFVYAFLYDQPLADLLLILVNAGIYGYWFFINKVAVGQRRLAIFTASIQPIINVLFYIPLGAYIFQLGVPADIVIAKLYGGMIVFLAVSYLILFVLDRPAKRELQVSGVALLTSAIGTSLYNLAADTRVLGSGGTVRDLEMDILSIKGRKGYKAFFINPDIHFGPFYSVGGSSFPETMGDRIAARYRAAPFIVHSTVNIDDNPMSTRDVWRLTDEVCRAIEGLGSGSFRPAKGFVRTGRSGPCSATNISLNNVNLLTLTKAPMVTEDIDRNVGVVLKGLASNNGSRGIIIDAHNSRFESATKEELQGVYKGSRYAKLYQNAIMDAVSGTKQSAVRFGSSHMKIASQLNHNKDLGPGYTSVGVFDFNGKRFGLVFFDANNMLPGFRAGIINHVRKRYGLDVELCTTDTHAVNTLALSASNALGRVTTHTQVLPIIDRLFEEAIENIEPVRIAYVGVHEDRFPVWGAGSKDAITKVGMQIVRRSKYVVPLLVVAAFIIAAWIIYIL